MEIVASLVCNTTATGRRQCPHARSKPIEDAGSADGQRQKVCVRSETAQSVRDTTRSISKTPAAAPTNGNKRKQDLVIVESPAKAKTINKYLGANFKVLASYGHVRDLPRSGSQGEEVAGIDIEDGWMPTYVVVDRAESNGRAVAPPYRQGILAELKREAAKSATSTWRPTPTARARRSPGTSRRRWAWTTTARLPRHLQRDHQDGGADALAHPGKIDMDRVQAQEARRILDRVVGYPLSNSAGQEGDPRL